MRERGNAIIRSDFSIGCTWTPNERMRFPYFYGGKLVEGRGGGRGGRRGGKGGGVLLSTGYSAQSCPDLAVIFPQTFFSWPNVDCMIDCCCLRLCVDRAVISKSSDFYIERLLLSRSKLTLYLVCYEPTELARPKTSVHIGSCVTVNVVLPHLTFSYDSDLG